MTKNRSAELAKLIKLYRIQTGLTQEALSLLTFELTERGIVNHGIQRAHIVRLEGIDPDTGQAKVPKPHPDTLFILAQALAERFHQVGDEAITADDIFRHLMNTQRSRISSRDVSPAMAEIDAILSIASPDSREMIENILIDTANSLIRRLKEYTTRRRAQQRDTKRNEP